MKYLPVALAYFALGVVVTWFLAVPILHPDYDPASADPASADPAPAERPVHARPRLDPDQAEDLVWQTLYYDLGADTETVSCPSPPIEEGRVFFCAAAADGLLATIEVEITVAVGPLARLQVGGIGPWR